MINKYPLDGFVLEYMRVCLGDFKYDLVLDAFNIVQYLNTNNKGVYYELLELDGRLQELFNKDSVLANIDILATNLVNNVLKERFISVGIIINQETDFQTTVDICKGFYKMLDEDDSIKEHYIETLNNTSLPLDEQFVLLLNEYTDSQYMEVYSVIDDIVIDYITDALIPKNKLDIDERIDKLIKYDNSLQNNYIVSKVVTGDLDLHDSEVAYSNYITIIEDWYKPKDVITDLAIIIYLTGIEDVSAFVYDYMDIDRIVEALSIDINTETFKQQLHELACKIMENA